MSRVLVPTPVRRFSDGRFVSRPDTVAGEEPLEIRWAGTALAVTMRTPGHDVELVHGYLHAEGLIGSAADLVSVRYCEGVDDEGRNTYNVLDARPAAALDPARLAAATRAVTTTSACGVCGTASIEALHKRTRHPLAAGPRFAPDLVATLPDLLRPHQRGFARTGGLHAAGLAAPDGSVELVREDVGRHNAVDKVVGAALLADRLPLSDRALVTSSRASFELVQKAVLAGIGLLVAVSAPSSLAVELARATGLTLVGFTRTSSFNVYSGAQRVIGA